MTRTPFVLPLLVSALAASCAAPPASDTVASTAPPSAATATSTPTASMPVAAAGADDEVSVADCTLRGGSIVKVGKLQKDTCAMPYADAGKACRDDDDCTGICKAEAADQAPGTPATGTCQANSADRFGCYTAVNDGKVDHTICVD